MQYEEFNKLYKQIYKERFQGIEHTDFEYCYLEEEHYALRKLGNNDFVIVRARSPFQALYKLTQEIL